MIFAKEAFETKHVLITGATGGIGEAVAVAAAEHGMKVTLTGRNPDKLKAVTETVRAHGGSKASVQAVRGDLTVKEDRSRMLDEAMEAHGPLHHLVNNAGIAKGAVMEDLTEEDLRDVMELNFTSTVLFTQEVYHRMTKANSGETIVNVASLSGLRGTYGATAYCGSKFALIGFTQSFAYEAIEHGIRVNAVCPGFVETDMARSIIQRKAERKGRTYEEEYKTTMDSLPSKRITQPDEVANSILYLMSPAAGNIIGESMKISGGAVMHG
ncbi:SDR family NAD(P)-dependent oxidoreductase [Salisediminibacterium beveridgei]|uniref:3-oxoacyl-[acyl-carrier protein] reductase n=1 Tax=Salisediminibacterium beveridgei TaxID=632773 RepID=A0A1D7QS52_9BACI|nr:SDR family NAD(P)-dependent oxidoreductase [Salisediminibacterium beveridgei]AOM81821.1 3-oxoacyl-[acyl-carrier protein] reductase [Salisediminibacterium beveridgei]